MPSPSATRPPLSSSPSAAAALLERRLCWRPESWRPYPGWEGWYEASDKGRARSVDRLVIYQDGRQRQYPGLVLAVTMRKGYPGVTLCRPGEAASVYVHAMVLAAFDRTPLPGEEARHGPRGPLFNWWPEDLCWGTHGDNLGADRERDGTLPRGERHGMARLTEAKVRQIRVRRAAGESPLTIAADYGIHPDTVRGIVSCRRWAHVA